MGKALGGGCSCLLMILIFNLAFGGITFDYVMFSLLGKDVPWYADMFAGTILGEFTVPIAVICWIIRLCGVPVPFVH
jgi:hypothetical protein